MAAALASSSVGVGVRAVARRTAEPRKIRASAASGSSRNVNGASRRRLGRVSHVARAGGAAAAGDAVNDVANMDALIDLLVAADEEALVKLVAENVLSFDQKLWIRLASRSDAAETQEEKDAFMTLAGKCMKLSLIHI